MDGTCSTIGRGEVHTGLWWRQQRKRDHLEDAGVKGKIILRWIFNRWDGGHGLIDLAQDRAMWRALVNAVMNRRVPYNAGNFLTS